jgi:hypothetical protein
VFVTAAYSQPIRKKCIEAGGQLAVSKPMAYPKLKEILDSYFFDY